MLANKQVFAERAATGFETASCFRPLYPVLRNGYCVAFLAQMNEVATVALRA